MPVRLVYCYDSADSGYRQDPDKHLAVLQREQLIAGWHEELITWDHNARVWEAETGRQLAELKGHTDAVLSATYRLDGKRIVTASEDSTARVWDVSPETQTADQLAKLIRCKMGTRFDREDSDIIIPILPNFDECLPSPQLP